MRCWPDDAEARGGVRIARRLALRRGETLWRQAEAFGAIYVVAHGSLRLSVLHPDGHEQVTGFGFAGEIVGLDGFALGRHACTATALEPTELLVAIRFPVPEKAGYAKMRNPASRYVMAGAFVSRGPMGVRVAINGAGPCVFRQTAMEAALSANWSADAVAAIKQDADGLNSDIHGSAEYRAHLVSVMAKRAVLAAG